MKFLYKVKLFFHYLFYGLRNADNIFGGKTDSGNEDIKAVKEQEPTRLSEALLRGIVTQEVEELRHRTYFVDREAKNYEYYGPMLAKKKDAQDYKEMKYDSSDGFDVITIQENKRLITDTLKELSIIDKNEINTDEYTLNINRDGIARFRLEQYIKIIIVKYDKEKDDYYVDFYVSKYAEIPKHRSFINEILDIKNNNKRSDILDFIECNFITSHAWKIVDNIKFSFVDSEFISVNEFDGFYVLKFKVKLNQREDILEKYHNDKLAEKYKNKEKKEVTCFYE